MQKIILSLTSTFERSHLLFYSIQSLLNQSIKPDILLLNISKEQYLKDSGFKSLPDFFKDIGATINVVDNMGSYRKLLPAIAFAGEDDLIVTADDDILYGPCWLEDLVQQAEKYPGSIICCRARRIKKNIFGNWQNYDNWHLINESSKGLDILPTGGAGAVYRKSLLDVEFLMDKGVMNIAPTTDDLWFRMSSLRKKTPVAVCPKIDQSNIYLKHRLGLDKLNIGKVRYHSAVSRTWNRIRSRIKNYMGINQTKNDLYWDAICKYSQLSKPDIKHLLGDLCGR